MTGEHDLSRGRGDGAGAVDQRVVPTIAERHKARFDELSGAFRRGEFDRENEDGSVTKVVSYERYIDPLDRKDMAILGEFRLRAAAVGLREAFSPLVLPTGGVDSPEMAHRPLTFVQLGYEQPAKAPPSSRTQS
jgi:hypothetical protein